ncbi:MAG: DUF167 domain-containing protein [Brevinematales bacterium]
MDNTSLGYTMGKKGISITVVPKSSREGIFLDGDTIKIYVHASPVDGEANIAVKKTISAILGVPKSKIVILQGEKNRHKIVSIENWDEEKLKAFLVSRDQND